jgi:hypothetical protein
MASVFDNVQTVYQTNLHYNPTDRNAYATGECPFCEAHQFGVVAVTTSGDVLWGRCVACGKGIVANDGVIAPTTLPLREPAGLPEVEKRVWQEVRQCLSVGAYAAAVMLCRKLLFHIAVTNGLAAKNDRGWAPNFTECTDHLLSVGLITARMRPWVNRIKDVGNEANHEIVPITEEQASDVSMFSQKLLELAFEMDDAMAAAGRGDLGE